MPEPGDIELLKQYAGENSEAAFATLVSRYINLVYSAALRNAGDSHAAEEITQAVFIILARKAKSLGAKTILSGWLYQTARLTAANYLRTEKRRQKREQEAFMQSLLNETEPEIWRQIAPLLDDAMGRLGERDRNAIVLRFFENKNLREVGAALGASEDAAKMRVNRALEKLRKFFAKRGVTFSGAAIAGMVSSNSVQAAPVGLAKTISAVAIAKGAAAGGSTLTLVKGALKIMAWTKMKTAIVVGAGIVLATGTTTVVVEKIKAQSEPSWADDPKSWKTDSRALSRHPPVLILRPTRFPNDGSGITWGAAGGEKFMLKNTTAETLLSDAYQASSSRMILPASLPPGRFDLMLTLTNRPREALQEKIRKQLGLAAHGETREMDVLALKVKAAAAPGLQVSRGKGSSSWSSSDQEIEIKNVDGALAGFASSVESLFHQPVINRTGLDGKYDIHLKWSSPSGGFDRSVFEQAMLEQLGLELVPGREPIEMLVVEKVK